MSKHIAAWTVGLLFIGVSGAFGTEEPTFTREAAMAIAAVFQERAGVQRLPDAALLLDLQHLIAREMNFPDNAETPGVAVASAPMMIGMRFRDVPGDRGAELAAASAQPEIVAVYDDEDRMIYLPEAGAGKRQPSSRSSSTNWYTTCKIWPACATAAQKSEREPLMRRRNAGCAHSVRTLKPSSASIRSRCLFERTACTE